MSVAVENKKGWKEWVDFMVKTHDYLAWDVRLTKQFEFLQNFLQRLPPGGRLLDVGAGQCEMGRFFEDFDYVGVDLAVGDVEWDYSKLHVISDVMHLPFLSETFDGAINIWVAEHVRDPIAMVAEIARVLKPGGYLMAFVPFVVHEHQAPHDYYRFTRFGTAAILQDNGFEQIEVVPDSSVGFALSYECAKHLNTIRKAAGMPVDWKSAIDNGLNVVSQLMVHSANEKVFPAAAPGLSFLALGRKPENWRPTDRRGSIHSPRTAPAPLAHSRRAPRRINVGCGHQKMPGWIGLDRVQTEATDIVRDITRGLPFDDSSVDEIYCDNVLEHVGPSEDFIFVLNEFYRVLKPGGVATIIVPDGRSQAAWQDPTHQRAFVPRSGLYWNQDLPWPRLYGINANFDVRVEEYGDPTSEAFLKFTCRARPKQ